MLLVSLLLAVSSVAAEPVVITLEDALKIALSENVSVKVADQEIQRTTYAKRGTYAALFPTIDGSAAFQRTIEKQVMYMDGAMSAFAGGSSSSSGEGESSGTSSSASSGIEIGRWNTASIGVSASMPLINAQLWESIKVSGQDVELAVEKARSSRLSMVTSVKSAYYAVLLAKQAYQVYKDVYDNALANYTVVKQKYEVQKVSDLELARSSADLAAAVPTMIDAYNNIELTLWQLKAVLGIDLERQIDTYGELEDYASCMGTLFSEDQLSLDANSTMRQLEIQAEQLASAVKVQQYATLPSLALAFSYTHSAMTNDFKFSEWKWTPYSYVGLSLNIPIFAGGKRANNINAAKVQQAEFNLQKADTERQLRIAIHQSISSMETAMKSYDSAKNAYGLAQKAYDITSESYKVGRSTLTDLNDAELTLVQSRLQVCQSIYTYLQGKASLEETLGHDIEY